MARFRAIPSAAEGPASADEQAPGASKNIGAHSVRIVLPPLTPDIDPDRYASFASMTLLKADERFADAALETAKRLRCRQPVCKPWSDRTMAGYLARYLLAEAVRVDGLNYEAAMRRANVDRYLELMKLRMTGHSIKSLQSVLYAAGRLVHPCEYPPRHGLAVDVARSTATSPQQAARLYALAPALPTALSRRLLAMLDLCYHAGARPADLKILRGTDITQTTWDGEPVALVPLANRVGGSRIVPVSDPAASRRLLEAAAERRTRCLITVGEGNIGRNSVNKISEQLTRRGHEGVNAAALRHGWIVNLAQQVPAALLMQLADVGNTRVLAEQQHLLPSYRVEHAVTLLKEKTL